MTPVLVFGASRGTGLLLAQQLRQQGVAVQVMLRESAAADELLALGVSVVRGDALLPGDVARAFAAQAGPCDVVSLLGGGPGDCRVDADGNINVIDQAVASGRVHRFVLVTAMGCGEMAPYRSPQAIAAFGAVVDAKSKAEVHLQAAWPTATILRPGGLRDGEATGQGILCVDPQVHGFIQRADLAALVVRVLAAPEGLPGAFAAVDAGQAQCVNPVQAVALG